MGIAAQLIIGLLLALLGMVGYGTFRVVRAVRVLSEQRLKLYVARLGELHEILDAMRRRRKLPQMDQKLNGALSLVQSFPTMRKESETLEAFRTLARKQKEAAPVSEISAAEQAAERALVELNVAMREDLSLNTGPGRFPNAEVFRKRRGLKTPSE